MQKICSTMKLIMAAKTNQHNSYHTSSLTMLKYAIKLFHSEPHGDLN